MQISRKDISPDRLEAIRRTLTSLSLAADQEWPVCGASCPNGTARRCHRNCPDIPWALSNSPRDYPLEPAVAPLVYELHRFGGIQTCWSCQGHAGAGGVWKLPQVWFYAVSQMHLRILADAVAALSLSKRLHVDWEVAVTHSDPNNPDTTYALRPKHVPDRMTLDALQADVATLADCLVPQSRKQARTLRTAADGFSS